MMFGLGKSRSVSDSVKITELRGGETRATAIDRALARVDVRPASIASDDAVAIAVALNKRFNARPLHAASSTIQVAGYRIGCPPGHRIAFYACLLAALAVVALNFDAEAFVKNNAQISAPLTPGAQTEARTSSKLVYRVKAGLRAITTAVCRISLPLDPREGPTATAGIRN